MKTKPWLKHYDEGVPHTLKPYPQRTLIDIVRESAAQRPDHPALLFKGRAMSNADLERLSNAFANALVQLGVKKGDRVALLLPNTPQLVLALLGAWKAGAIAVPMNPLYTEQELESSFLECGAETVLVLTRFYAKVKALQPRTKVRNVIATNIKEYLPPALRVLFTLLREKKEGDRITLHPGDLWLADLLNKHAGARRPKVAVKPKDPAVMLFTGGTTGTPKVAVGTHHALLISGMQIHAWFKNMLVDWEEPLMLNMPLFHVYGLAGVFAAGLIGHAPLAVVPNPRDINDMLATIQKVKPAFLPGVPTLFIALLNHPKVQAGKASLKSLKLSISGAASLLADTKERFERATGGRIIEGFGITESMMAAVITPPKGQYKPGAVGIPLPDVEIRIVDADTGKKELPTCKALPTCQVGEIIMRAPQLMKGYWKKPAETANVIRNGWLYTGDLGYLDEDGYMYIVDRKKDVIKPSGFQVWPREVEEVIASHPAVAEVGVAGVPDPYQGQAVKAWVVLRPGQKVTADELRAYCRRKLAAYKVPKHIEFRSSLPKSTIGKVLRRVLAQQK
ncbi:MAG: AMP-dependent synthetase [Deltaproteobacteria bacterium RBG_16_54_11]|nr:MAG: AMP-dependent synthetase [Deltaproteobacteria bacterium RBG_16_54_11]